MASFIDGFQNDGQFQRDALARETGETLFPNVLFRADVMRTQFEGTIGQSKTIPVPGLLEIDTSPRVVGVTPTPDQQSFEYYKVTPEAYGRTVSQSLPGNYASAVGPYYQKKKAQVLQAAQTVNRILRNKLYAPYMGGHSIVDSVAGGGTLITVNSLNGFSASVDPVSGYPVPVSSASPRAYLRNGTLVAGSVIIGATPNDPLNPLGPGVLTLDVAVGPFVAGDRIDAVDASPIIRPNSVATVDGINAGDFFNGELVQRAVTLLRDNSVPQHSDGYYHVHFPPAGEQGLLRDNLVQRMFETRGLEDDPFAKFAFGRGLGCTFYSNNQCPDLATTDNNKRTSSRPATAPDAVGAGDIGGDIVNASGVRILRAVVTGGGVIQEHYVDEMSYMTEAGYLGRVEARSVENRGIEVRADGIRFVDQAPTDIFGEAIQMGWSMTADWAPPTNRLSGKGPAAYKLGVIIECALPG